MGVMHMLVHNHIFLKIIYFKSNFTNSGSFMVWEIKLDVEKDKKSLDTLEYVRIRSLEEKYYKKLYHILVVII